MEIKLACTSKLIMVNDHYLLISYVGVLLYSDSHMRQMLTTPELCPACEHPVGFVGSARCEVVHHHADVTLCPINCQWLPHNTGWEKGTSGLHRCIHTSNKPLSSSRYGHKSNSYFSAQAQGRIIDLPAS